MMRFCYVGILISTMSCFEFFFGSRLYVSKLFVICIYIVGYMFGLFLFWWMDESDSLSSLSSTKCRVTRWVGYEYFCRFYESNGCLEKFLVP